MAKSRALLIISLLFLSLSSLIILQSGSEKNIQDHSFSKFPEAQNEPVSSNATSRIIQK